MRKADIARRIHQQAGIPEKEAAALLEWILELLKTALQNGEAIIIPGFGKFTVRSKVPRTGRNFKTGEALIIPTRRVVTFHSSPLLKTEINSVPTEQQEAVTRTE